ncbi:hypothetical protein [Sinorhizobium fredii]|uniref:DUF7946 domain-containing protein n=1 Tax=Rhizobium fredii TaxID=380 RepID=UPI003393ED6A
MSVNLKFALSFEGNDADEHVLDFYDAADALTGFQRSLALTTHLVLHGEIITQAPALRGARILIKSPEAGSWKVITVVTLLASGAHTLGTAPRDTVLGHLVASTYDYLVNETLGFHVDFDSTLGKQYDELNQRGRIAPQITQSQVDSLMEKTESSIKEMHRPIAASQTAETANVTSIIGRRSSPIATLDSATYDYVNFTRQVEQPVQVIGRVSSYNINTFAGRIFLDAENRPIPFELAEGCRDPRTVELITSSLRNNARNRLGADGAVSVNAFLFESSTGRIKRILITQVGPL